MIMRWRITTLVLLALLTMPLVAGAQTLHPQQLSATVALFNPTSGLYAEVTQSPVTKAFPTLDLRPANPTYIAVAPLSGIPANEYGRMSWHSLEPNEGQYDFSIIDNVLQPCPVPAGQLLCLPQGVKFGFRIMAFNPQVGGDTNVTTGSDGYPVYADVPAYLETSKHGWLLPVDPNDQTQGHYFIPDWNDPVFLKRIEALLSALGDRYRDDPRIGPVDIGLYGSWGEWHTSGLPDAADYKQGIPYVSTNAYYDLNTAAYQANTGKAGAYEAGTIQTKSFIVDAYAKAFAHTQLVMLTDDGAALCYALGLSGLKFPIGLRRDSLGASDWNYQFPNALPNCDTPDDQAMIENRWQTAPFMSETYGNGASSTFPCQTFTTDSVTGAYDIDEQVMQSHVAGIKNGSFCSGVWANLSSPEQQALTWADLKSGYRFAPIELQIQVTSAPSPNDPAVSIPVMTIQTNWINTGVTPAYHEWDVRFSLWRKDNHGEQSVIHMQSQADLRKILPTGDTPAVVSDSFYLPPDLPPGLYQLRMRILDPQGYMKPMQLALPDETPEGFYPLGFVTIPKMQ